MSKADEMFEELGYRKLIWKNCIEYRKSIEDDEESIRFWIGSKTFEGYDEINMQELQAINEKCKEMGWIV